MFICGWDQDSSHAAAMQATYNILVWDLLQIMPYFWSSLRTSTILAWPATKLFGLPQNLHQSSHFTFPAVAKFVMQQPEIHKLVLCYCPTVITEHLWDLTDQLLPDGIEDDTIFKHLRLFLSYVTSAMTWQRLSAGAVTIRVQRLTSVIRVATKFDQDTACIRVAQLCCKSVKVSWNGSLSTKCISNVNDVDSSITNFTEDSYAFRGQLWGF